MAEPQRFIEVTHPSFPSDFAIRVIPRPNETDRAAAQRSYMTYKVRCAFDDYRPASGRRMCITD